MEENLKKKTIAGMSWSSIDNLSNTGIGFIVGIVLANVLSPEQFGIIGLITIFIAVSNSIVDSGFSNALIRKTDATNTDYNTVFHFNFLLGIVLYIVLYFCAPAISQFFEKPILIPITRVLGLTLIINALAIIQRTILVKNVDFKTQTKISLISGLGSGVVGIGMVYTNFGIWSLVGQQLSKQLFTTLFLWVYNKWRPAVEFSTKSFKELFGFGSKLLISGLIDTVYKNVYYLVIGKFYSPAQLGQYSRAEQFNGMFSSNLTTVVQRVSYPVLSSIQDESQRLRNAFRRLIKTTMFVTFPCMLGLAAVAKPLVLILIGKQWLPSVIFLQILCFQGMMYPLQSINLNILQVKGRSDIYLRLEIIKKIIYVLPVLLGIFINIYWMLLSSTFISIFITYSLNSHYSGKEIKYSTYDQFKDVIPFFLMAITMAILTWSISLLPIPMYGCLALQLLVGVVLYVGMCELFHIAEYNEIKHYLLDAYQSRTQSKQK
jgi:teichuronic acid exporter